MRIPLAWLREFVPTELSAEDLTELMVPRGVLIEGIERPWEGLDGVVAAQVLEVRDHPNSDRLCLARIAHGAGETELVVGIRNMGPGDLVPWAPPGARVPGVGEPLGRREIRGVVSDGMLCSARELAISPDHGGILILDPSWERGEDFGRRLGLDDPVLDVEVEPNRPDFLSIYGVAREVAAATGLALAPPDLELEETDRPASEAATVRIEAPDGCPRYVARVIEGVAHGSSPLIAQARLTACGMRPIDAVVDATNYAMLEIGQPLHGFDMADLSGPGIVVRRATDGERLTTLDGVERTFTDEDLLICDLERPVAIAGVMGGQTSEVSPSTEDVLLEAAHFTRGGVLLTARRLDLHSEASHRFERGTDPEAVEAGAARGAALISAWAGGRVLRGVAQDGLATPRRWVSMRPSRAGRVLGYDVSATGARSVFDELGMANRGDEQVIEVEVPGYRTDVEDEVDLIEEIVRIQGYDNVGSTLPRSVHAGGLPGPYALARRAKGALLGAGLRECRPAPFSSQEDLDLFGDRDAVRVANPLRADEGFMRTRLTPGLIRAVERNRSLGTARVALFEVGTTFRLGEGSVPFTEHRKAGFVLSGPADRGWAEDDRDLDVLDAKGVLGSLLADLGFDDWGLADAPAGPFHPGRSARLIVREREVGVLGEIHPRVCDELGIEGRVAVGVVGLSALSQIDRDPFTFKELPRFPPVRRDLAFIVDDEVAAGAVRGAIERTAGDLLGGCVLFDVFRGEPVPAGKKSLAYALDLRATDRTLTDEEAQQVVDAIVTEVGGSLGGTLRAG